LDNNFGHPFWTPMGVQFQIQINIQKIKFKIQLNIQLIIQ
jgi:hypothetical protein